MKRFPHQVRWLHHWWAHLSWPAACKNACSNSSHCWTQKTNLFSDFVVCCIYIGILVCVPVHLKASLRPWLLPCFAAPLYCKNLCQLVIKPLPCCSHTAGGLLWNYCCWAGGLDDGQQWLVVLCHSSHSCFRSSQTKSSQQGCFLWSFCEPCCFLIPGRSHEFSEIALVDLFRVANHDSIN